MNILTPAAMSYKNLKKQNELLAKLQIIKSYKQSSKSKKDIAKIYNCHRNTVGNIIIKFNTLIPKRNQNTLLNSTNDINNIVNLMKPILDVSSKPKTRHPKQATIQQENKIIDIFKNYLKVGPKRMRRHLKRAYHGPGNINKKVPVLEKSLSELSLPQIIGIYKRNKLKLKKRHSANGNVKHLYDYKKIAAFEYMHLDTKHILDLKALPSDIYQKFQLNKNLPIYEWNLIDAKSRFRFIAYSHNLASEFGYKFLVSTIQYIRGIFSNYDLRMNILTDNGTEFYGGSKTKEGKWNKVLDILNSKIQSYEPGHDIRKNLIERSHKSDDEEFYIPRGGFITDKKSFLIEAKKYSYYWNAERPHSGIGMDDRTPLEVLIDSGLVKPQRLLNYPTIIFEDNIFALSDITNVVELKSYLINYFNSKKKKNIGQKKIENLKYKFPFIEQFAQKVLTPYLRFFKQYEQKILRL